LTWAKLIPQHQGKQKSFLFVSFGEKETKSDANQ
jgi:hypothetical protein